MTISMRTMLVATLSLFGLVVSAMLPHDPRDIGGVDAAYPDAPPLHVSVPTAPFAPTLFHEAP